MRVLLLFRGAPGCGKSTFIEKNGLKPYTLSADDIRLMYSAPILLTNGTFNINPKNESKVWKTLFDILENRMQQGDFSVIDATNSRTIEMRRYLELAKKYRYRIYCIDMTDIPIEVAKERNKQRSIEKQVPEDAIDKMYARFKNQSVPSGIKVIKPDELETIWYKKPIDLSDYSKIHIVGDIHGCNTALQEYFKDNPFKENEFYLFTGDYLDRGIENAETIKFLLEFSQNKNVMFLEGNHECHLRAYGNREKSCSKEFENNTKEVLIKNNIFQKDIRNFCRNLAQCMYFKYYDKEFLVTHGGLSNLPENLTLISTEQLIKGSGRYEDMTEVNNSFILNTSNNIYQVHGHRNIEKTPIQTTERTFNLEGGVEFGGELRILQVTKDDIVPIMIKNTVYKINEKKIDIGEKVVVPEFIQISNIINEMRNSKYIREKKFGNISSFNFSAKAFEDKIWNNITTKARGLYIDTINNKIAVRSYDKFFNINERPETEISNLQHQFTFPVTAYVKENGFLGIISWNTEKDDLLIATKSVLDGIYVDYMKNILYNIYSNETINKLKEYLKNNDVSFVFECCDHINDLHIIEYEKDELILLDIIHNKLDYEKESFNEMVRIADYIGLKHKEKAYVLNNWTEFYKWYTTITTEDYKYNGKNIEGFVIEDSKGFMVKIKLHFYQTWKKLRQIFNTILKYGYLRNTGSLITVLDNEFYQWTNEFCSRMTKEEKKKFKNEMGTNVCWIRNEFYRWKSSKNE